MKNLWNNMILLLPLQELMSLTSVQGKFCAFTLCSIFYVDSLHAAWALHEVPPKVFRPSIWIELMVAFAPTISQVSLSLCLIFTPALSVPLYGVAMGRSPT
ncbi:hypothetical protein BHM03_00000625 [Ensete ventricosum]|nr:hypothetical protein BHM03_00000625 [Ensete ventricosum]